MFCHLGPLEVGLDRRHWIFLRSVYTPFQDGRHRLRVQRQRCRQLCGFCAHLLVHFFQLDYIRLIHGQWRYLCYTVRINNYYDTATGYKVLAYGTICREGTDRVHNSAPGNWHNRSVFQQLSWNMTCNK